MKYKNVYCKSIVSSYLLLETFGFFQYSSIRFLGRIQSRRYAFALITKTLSEY